jgi:hypothetical protein
LSAPVNASANGATQKVLNAAAIQNKGAELTLNLHPIQRVNNGWDLGFLYGRNRGKVLSLNGAISSTTTSKDSGAIALRCWVCAE